MHSIYIKYTSHNHKQLMKSGGSSSDHYFTLPSDSSFRSVILCNVFTTEREVNHLLKTVGVAKACGPYCTGNSAYSQTLFWWYRLFVFKDS